jgi:NADH:ubiquinone oxidoreductase subunit H
MISNKINLLIPELIITTNMSDAIITALKFLILIAMLVFIRGGIPRYRYDFLTKIGWIKFLSLVLAVFLSTLLLVYIM